MIYLDYNATAPLRPEVKAAMLAVMDEPLNSSSIHAQGRAARKLLEDARKTILNFVNADALVFCGSGTEANNFALVQGQGGIAISAIEHDSVFKAVPKAKVINVDENGIIDLDHLEKILKDGECKLVSVMLANNETGVIQPVKEVAAIAHKYGALVHCDAVQAFGKININFKELDIDFMTISSHKIGGPMGSAALIYKSGIELKPLMFGGGQEKNKRPGTENIPAIIGFAESTKYVSRETTLAIRDYLEEQLLKSGQDIVIYSKNAPRLPNTTLVSMPNIEATTQLIHFDTNGISVSSGAACSSGKVEVSRVLKAMNAPLAKNAIRVSMGWQTTKKDVDLFIKSWTELYQRTREQAA